MIEIGNYILLKICHRIYHDFGDIVTVFRPENTLTARKLNVKSKQEDVQEQTTSKQLFHQRKCRNQI